MGIFNGKPESIHEQISVRLLKQISVRISEGISDKKKNTGMVYGRNFERTSNEIAVENFKKFPKNFLNSFFTKEKFEK